MRIEYKRSTSVCHVGAGGIYGLFYQTVCWHFDLVLCVHCFRGVLFVGLFDGFPISFGLISQFVCDFIIYLYIYIYKYMNIIMLLHYCFLNIYLLMFSVASLFVCFCFYLVHRFKGCTKPAVNVE